MTSDKARSLEGLDIVGDVVGDEGMDTPPRTSPAPSSSALCG